MNSVFKETFNEFMNLSYTKKKDNTVDFLKDIDIDDYIIARLSNKGCDIIYLYNGSILKISNDWINLFSSFNTYSGDKLEFFKNDQKDNIDKLGYLFTKFLIYIDSRLSIVSGGEFLSTLGEIYSTKTIDFINWTKENYKIDLDPIEFITLNDKYKI